MLTIDYYSDVLCVWAWIAQRRIDELNSRFGDRIIWREHYVDVFGDTEGKMQLQWSQKGGFDGFARHVLEAADRYEDAAVSADLWRVTRPKTSANAHLLIKAAGLGYGSAVATDLALAVRSAFFVGAEDIADFNVLYAILLRQGLALDPVRRVIENGAAMAGLMADYRRARDLAIKGSPSYVLDDGRQTLYGNVGYRVLQANIEELLKKPAGEASWC